MTPSLRRLPSLAIEVPDCLKDESILDFPTPPSLPPSARDSTGAVTSVTPGSWCEPLSPSAVSAISPRAWGLEGASAPASASLLPAPFAYFVRCSALAADCCGRTSASASGVADTRYECLAYSPRQVSSSGGSSQYTNTLFGSSCSSDDDDEEAEEPSSPNAAACGTTRLISFSACASAFASTCSSPRPLPSPPPKQQPQPLCPATLTSIATDGDLSSCCDCCCMSPRTEARVAAAFGRFDWSCWASAAEWAALRDADMAILERFGLLHWTLDDLHDAQLAEAFAAVDWAAVAATCTTAFPTPFPAAASSAASATTSATTSLATTTTTTSCLIENDDEAEEAEVDFVLLREAADEAVTTLLLSPTAAAVAAVTPPPRRGGSGYGLCAEDVLLMCADMEDLEACGLVGWTPQRLARDDTAYRRLVLEAEEDSRALGGDEGEGEGEGEESCGSTPCTSAGSSPCYSRCSSGRSAGSSSSKGGGGGSMRCAAWWLAEEEAEAVRVLLVFGQQQEEECC